MENIFYIGNFYPELLLLCDDNEWDEDFLNSQPDDFEITVEGSQLEVFFDFSVAFITENIDEERMSESENEMDQTEQVLKDNIDFERINALLPKLYYADGSKYIITKKDLLEAVQ